MDVIKKHKYIILGIIVIVVAFLLILFFFSDSYALEGYGVTNLSCDKTKVSGGEEINCIITGTVSEGNDVSSLSSQIVLSENLELVSVTTDEIWNGNGDDGNIQLYYKDDYQVGDFAIGSFVVKMKENTINSTESIELKETYFYGGDTNDWNEESIKDSKVEITTPQFSSDKYDFTNDYIVADTKDISEIISNVNTDDCGVVVNIDDKDVTTGNIVEGAKLKVSYNDKVLKEYDIVYIGSTSYDLGDGYVITSLENINDLASAFDAINGNVVVKNGKLVLTYNSSDIRSYDIINVVSSEYRIDANKGYVFSDTLDILDSVEKTDNVTLEVVDGNLNLTYDGQMVKALKIYTISSEVYDINIMDGYAYVGKKTSDIENNITSNADVVVDGNKIKLSDGDNVLFTLDIVAVESSKYILDYDNSYIYTKNTSSFEEVKKNLSFINSSVVVNDNLISLKYNDILVKEFNWYYITSEDYKLSDDTIYTKETLAYDKFISGISFNSLTYKVYNADSVEVTSGSVDDNYTIKIYKDSALLDTYKIKLEYLEISNLNIDEDNKVIYKLKLGTTYSEVLENIDTSGDIVIKNREGTEVDVDSIVKTSDVITIELSSGAVSYTISVLGDLNYDGKVTVGDVSKLYSRLRGKITVDEAVELSGELNGDGKITVGDVSKLYSYLRKKISSLD